jgi:hypothetical protein
MIPSEGGTPNFRRLARSPRLHLTVMGSSAVEAGRGKIVLENLTANVTEVFEKIQNTMHK